MSQTVIKAENISKYYKLGAIGSATLGEDINRLWARVRGQEDPRLKIGQEGRNDFIWALKDVSFEVKQGEAVGIIGKNGAGKSTLLKILSRITSPTSGVLKMKGRTASLLEVGTGFHPELTGRENIFLNGAILGMTKAEISSKLDEIIDFSGIEKFIDTPVKRYSSGMRVRLAFAVAAHLDPEILIIDEVLAVGDAEFQKKCLGKMEEASRAEGRTVLFVSHQLGMINTLCTRAILMQQGKLVYEGTTGDTIDKYLSSGETDSNSPVVNFPADETLPAQVLGARLLNSLNVPSLDFDVFDPVFLEVTYVVREKIAGVDMGIVLERNGEIFAVSFDTDTKPERLQQREPGTYTVRVKLPGPLKAGIYKIANLGMGRTNVGPINSNKDCLIFHVEERSFDPSLKSYSASRKGIIVAALDWEMVSYLPH